MSLTGGDVMTPRTIARNACLAVAILATIGSVYGLWLASQGRLVAGIVVFIAGLTVRALVWLVTPRSPLLEAIMNGSDNGVVR